MSQFVRWARLCDGPVYAMATLWSHPGSETRRRVSRLVKLVASALDNIKSSVNKNKTA